MVLMEKKNISGNANCLDALNMLNYLFENIYNYVNDKYINSYLKILNVNINDLNIGSANFKNESKKFYKNCLKYPTIFNKICVYLKYGTQSIDFLKNFSNEQQNYITCLEPGNTKLIACAGSGKTRSIIARIKFMVEHNLAKPHEIYAITFSKLAAVDFHTKIRALFPDYDTFCKLKNFSTIDSLAKSILCVFKSHKSENVEILSIAFRNFLKDITPQQIKIINDIKPIRHLFIDEAQDLNNVQYELAMLLHDKFSTTIHLIGDPNQNIFQFRRSCSSYLTNFVAKQYNCTLNFRSTQEIIYFSEALKAVNTLPSKSATDRHGNRVIIVTKPMHEMHKMILQFISQYKTTGDLSDIAIICPTRGIGNYDTLGLSVFFNFFKVNNVPFNQLYDEAGTNDERHKSVSKKPGHINLMTYHGTKGLEFDVVFVMDFYQFLFNIKPNSQEHNIARYLLYVATSRAISTMYVCTYTNVHGGYLNHWITNVNPQHYIATENLKIPLLTFRDNQLKPQINGITELLSELCDDKLNMIDDMIKIRENVNLFTRRVYRDFSDIDRGKDESLFGIFCEELFYFQYLLSRRRSPRVFPLIQMIIESKFIVVNNENDFKLLKNYIRNSQLTWQKYDANRNIIPENICKLIDIHFTRDVEFSDFIVCTNSFVKIVELAILDIKTTYHKYLMPSNYNYDYCHILYDFFYLIVVQYAYDNNHYYYITNHGIDKVQLVDKGKKLFAEMALYAKHNYLTCDLQIKQQVYYSKMMLCGEIDFIELHAAGSTIVEIKCVKTLSIKYYVQLLLYNFCYYYQKNDMGKLFQNKFKILNLLTGLEHSLIISISSVNMANLLITLAETGNLKLANMNLVYDLETTGAISMVGPLKYHTPIPRSVMQKKNNHYYYQIMPHIIEIAIKDYETEMVIINVLINPNMKIDKCITDLTGITQEMVTPAHSINEIKMIIEKKLQNFINCKMLAHNGSRFDDKIMKYEKLINTQNVSFLDTLSVIPIHLFDRDILENKKLGVIYNHLFGSNFNAHRAMNDVDALIKIMKFLKVKF